MQKVIHGDEFNVVLIGDGTGDIIGMIPQRKVIITDKGKGFAGVVVNNPKLDSYARTIICLLKWRGTCELEIIQDRNGVFFLPVFSYSMHDGTNYCYFEIPRNRQEN